MTRYDKTKVFWNTIFSQFRRPLPETLTTGCESLDKSLLSLGKKENHVVDFGFGSGLFMLMLAQKYGGVYHGIELSEEACLLAERLFKETGLGNLTLSTGSIDRLNDIESASADLFICSNILDNLIPTDGLFVLSEVNRILKPQGKCFLKLNRHLDENTIRLYDLQKIETDFYLEPSGLYLWNLPNPRWITMLEAYFTLIGYEEPYIEKANDTNRLFLLEKTE